MNEQVVKAMFALIRKAVCGTEIAEDIQAAITPELLPQLYALSKLHDMAHLAAQALGDAGMLGQDEVSAKFQKQQMLAVYRYQRINYELQQICQALEDASIPFIPLKGAVIRKYYPEPWMRTSCDIDVLVHEDALEKAIGVLSETLRYKNEGRGTHDVSLFSESGVHVELHYSLIEEIRYPTAVKLLAKAWEYAELTNGSTYQHQLKDEMFYFYHTLHMAKHFEGGGCGVRSILDQWILDHRVPHDVTKRNALLEAGQLSRFDAAARALAEVWFSEQPKTELTGEMADYILTGGVYGNTESGIANKRVKKGGKISYVISRVFLAYDIIKMQYPILQKHRWLTPVMQVRRWFRLLFKGRLKKSLHELNVNTSISQEQVDKAADFLKKFGL